MWFKALNDRIAHQVIGLKKFAISREKNNLELENLKVIFNKAKNLMVVLADTRLVPEEIEVALLNHKLIIVPVFNMRANKSTSANSSRIQNRDRSDSSDAEMVSSEIYLDKKYLLDLKSYSIAGNGLIKIILNYKPYHFELN
jgi:hypothetical protein